MFLDWVVCEVNKGVFVVVIRVLMGREAEVALFEKVYLIVVSQENPYTDVKFTLANQHGTFYVLLDYETQDTQIVHFLLMFNLQFYFYWL